MHSFVFGPRFCFFCSFSKIWVPPTRSLKFAAAQQIFLGDRCCLVVVMPSFLIAFTHPSNAPEVNWPMLLLSMLETLRSNWSLWTMGTHSPSNLENC